MYRFVAAICVVVALLPFRAQAQCLPAGPQVLTFHSAIDDTEQPYGLYLPPGYDSTRRYPLVMMLHGAGSNHRLALRRVFGKSNSDGETDVEASRYFPAFQPEDYIVVSPYARGTMGYQGIAEKDVLDVLTDVEARFSVDPDRRYLTGLSMGGGGSLHIGLTHPDLWAAIAPVCPAAPHGTARFVGNALNVPVHIHQGGADPVVSPEYVKGFVEKLRAAGVEVGYTEYPGVGHNSWEDAYAEQQIFDWFAQYERNLYPERVQYASDNYRNAAAYWVRLEGLTPGTVASIDARFTDNNRLTITTEALDAFSLHLAQHPAYRTGMTLVLDIDGQKVKTRSATPYLHKEKGQWAVAQSTPTTGLRKRAGAEGPMSEVLADRHVYVYGTADDPPEELLNRRIAQATEAAEWSYYRGEFLRRIMVFPRILSDKQVRDSDRESAHLVLFGNASTNSEIARYADQLPIQLDPAASDYGLAYVYPMNGRYIFINSGHSIMKAPRSTKSLDDLTRYVAPPITLALHDYDDYVLYRNDTILATGRFDQQWQLPIAERKRMQATGVVTLKK